MLGKAEAGGAPARHWPARIVLLLGLTMAVGLLVRLLVAATSQGTNDVDTWSAFIDAIHERGVLAVYTLRGWPTVPSFRFNHSPPVAWCLALVPGIQAITGLGRAFLVRLPACLADTASALMLAVWISERQGYQRGLVAAALVALSPVAVLVSGFHGNTDPVFLALLVATVFAAQRGRAGLSGLCYGLALGVKIVPVIVLPIACGLPRDRTERRRFAAGLALTLAAWLPHYVAAPLDLIRQIFFHSGVKGMWGISEFLFRLHRQWPTSAFGPIKRVTYAFGGFVLVGLLWAVGVWLVKRRVEPLRAIAIVIAIFLVLAPGFGIQYLCWPVPFLAAVSPPLGLVYSLVVGSYLDLTYLHWSGGDALGHANTWRISSTGLRTPFLDLLRWLSWGTLVIAVVLLWRQARAAPVATVTPGDLGSNPGR